MIENPKFTVYGSQVQEWMEDIQKLKQERNKLREKCDKLNNNMIELKRKSEAFDEIKELINWFEENDRYEFEGQVEEITKIIKVLEEQ